MCLYIFIKNISIASFLNKEKNYYTHNYITQHAVNHMIENPVPRIKHNQNSSVVTQLNLHSFMYLNL